MSDKLLIAVLGPTASGKTGLSIKLSREFLSEIFSADSRQFYKELNIGVARPSREELSSAVHHFIGHISVKDSYSAGDYEKQTLEELEAYFAIKDTGILVGGSGLFVKAVLDGLDDFPEIPSSLRSELNKRLEHTGLESLVKELRVLDPDTSSSIDLTNPRRVIRALEVCIVSGKPYSFFKDQPKKTRPFTPVKVAIDWDRSQLYDRINQRTKQMFASGLVDEVKTLLDHRSLNALNTVGYSEVFDYLDGKLTREQAIEKVQQHTRNYAKRQLTWLRKQMDILWIQPEQELNEIVSQIRGRYEDSKA